MELALLNGAVPEWAYGYGSGYGDGYGYGSGSGYGDGYGYGYGDGDGYGYGSGSGSGYGSGSGAGYGSGSGSGYGSGYGSGSGSGAGSKDYWLGCLKYFSERWSEAQKSRLTEIQSLRVTIAYWWSDKSGKACNGGKNSPVTTGTVETVSGPLQLCGDRALHATHIPQKWKGERLWIVAMHGEVIGDEEKIGALKREIIGEAI